MSNERDWKATAKEAREVTAHIWKAHRPLEATDALAAVDELAKIVADLCEAVERLQSERNING